MPRATRQNKSTGTSTRSTVKGDEVGVAKVNKNGRSTCQPNMEKSTTKRKNSTGKISEKTFTASKKTKIGNKTPTKLIASKAAKKTSAKIPRSRSM